jgi:anti-sigma B factor antagonist
MAIENHPEVRVIKPEGIVTATTAEALIQELNECTAAKIKMVVLDLSAVSFIDSFGLGTLVTMRTKLRLAGSNLYLTGLQEQASCLLEFSDLLSIFDIFSSVKEFFAVMIYKNQVVLVQ